MIYRFELLVAALIFAVPVVGFYLAVECVCLLISTRIFMRKGDGDIQSLKKRRVEVFFDFFKHKILVAALTVIGAIIIILIEDTGSTDSLLFEAGDTAYIHSSSPLSRLIGFIWVILFCEWLWLPPVLIIISKIRKRFLHWSFMVILSVFMTVPYYFFIGWFAFISVQ